MPRPDDALGAIAARQDDAVTHAQLLDAGYTRHDIQGRVRRAQLHRRHRGVYTVGHAPPSLRTRARAAALACGPNAVVSHATAAALWGLIGPPPGPIHVTVGGPNPGSRPGIRLHRVGHLSKADVRTQNGLRLTSPARTICDLAATEPAKTVQYAIQEGIANRLLTEPELLAAVARHGNRRGGPALRAILALEGGGGFTRSHAERVLMEIVVAAGLPPPEKNVYVEGHCVDALWRAQRLIVEIDGFATHGTRTAFESDRRCDQQLRAAGWRVIRMTYRQLRDEPVRVGVLLARALGPRPE
jgi:very-short-patch-repair endonuclease